MEVPMATIGYARVSSTDQDYEGQVERLTVAGCEKVYSEKASGKDRDGRPELQKCLRKLKSGDTLVITRLDRLARSIRDLLGILDTLKATGATIKALDDTWLDTGSAHGQLILTIMGALAEFERQMIRSRCEEGIKRAKAQGKVFGRKHVLDHGQKRRIAERFGQGETMAALAKDYSCAVGTIWNVLHPSN
jgi:DNA invertase Pin-like site-specific DNA recombinase